MSDASNATAGDYDSLLGKLQDFANILTPGEQFALSAVLKARGEPSATAANEDGWRAFAGFIANNAGNLTA